ncbi:phage baseplate protein [Fusobacterium necrophorum]|uniref:phage baseplate protein n=1 Tax=Fusobacterium necrophorum TaxID=859 RepID=UPI000787BED0|nr:phage baseplate protein [Fusobacterium necrophorum]KYM45749.1 phage baseplate protein [Fusobacterium necrophorum subsp. funduliforme]MDK4496699.1 phage baseplate protein [Fusobacterium necrophorum]
MMSAIKGAIGFVHSINPTNYTAKVKLPEYENHITEDLAILSPLTFGNKIAAIPKVNTPVFCIFLGDDTDRGYIIGSYFSDKNLSESKEDEYKIDFQKSIVTIKEDGNIILKGNLTKIDSDVEITGIVTIGKDVTINGSMEAKKGFKTDKVDLKEGVLDIETVKYKELSKK